MPPLAAVPDVDPVDAQYWYMLGEIRAELARRRIAQDQLAPAIGLRQQYLSMRLSGRTPFRYPELMRLVEALGLTMADLARWSEGPGEIRSVTRGYRSRPLAVAS